MWSTKFSTALILIVVLCAAAYSAESTVKDSIFIVPSTSFEFREATANVSITGRVKTNEGRAIKGAWVTLRDAETNQLVRSTYSSPFGYYRLEQIESGRLYVLSVTHKRYLFVLPAHLLELNEDRTGVDFTGEASESN